LAKFILCIASALDDAAFLKKDRFTSREMMLATIMLANLPMTILFVECAVMVEQVTSVIN
jgi:hypothetical protein